MTSTLPPLVQACSGAIGSASANITTYPLDLVVTRLQTSRSKSVRGIYGAWRIILQVVRRHGVEALYDGLKADTGATLLSNFFYFYFYSFLRTIAARRQTFPTSKQAGASAAAGARELAIGFIAGIASRALSTPLNVVTTRMQTEREGEDDETNDNLALEKGDESDEDGNAGVLDIFKHIYKEEGAAGFWKGFPTTILLSLNPSLTLTFFQLFRRLLLRGKSRDNPGPVQAFVGAAFSNSIAVIILYPLMLAKTRLQGTGANKNSESMLDVWRTAVKRDGLKGLYQGLEAQIMKGFLTQGVTMMVKQRIEQLVMAVYLRRRAGQ